MADQNDMTEAQRLRKQLIPMSDAERNMSEADKAKGRAEVEAILKDARQRRIIKW